MVTEATVGAGEKRQIIPLGLACEAERELRVINSIGDLRKKM
jgi:hypothetical protein